MSRLLFVKTFNLPMDYMPLYGDETPFEYVCIHLNLAENYCQAILHLSVKQIKNTISILTKVL